MVACPAFFNEKYYEIGVAVMTDKKRKKHPLSGSVKETVTAWLFLTPSLVFLLIFTVFPILRSFFLSFHQYEMGMTSPSYIALGNYIKLAHMSLFWKVMGNSFYFALMTVIPSMIIGLGLAMLVNRKTHLVGFLRTSYFYPVMMPMIAIASIWMFIYMAKTGLLDQAMVSLGMKPLNVLSNKSTVLPFMSFMYVWKEAGYLMIFYLSGLQNISEEMYEAATIDGAGRWTLLTKITLPLLGPTTLFVSTMALTDSFKQVDHIVIMTEGAPNNASTLLLYYIYQQAFNYFNQGMASTLTVIMLIILLIIAMFQFVKSDKKIYYNG